MLFEVVNQLIVDDAFHYFRDNAKKRDRPVVRGLSAGRPLMDRDHIGKLPVRWLDTSVEAERKKAGKW